MALLYDKDFDQILTEILTDYSNLDSNPDISQGSMPFIMGSVLASMVWGLYRYNDYNSKQMFVDTADSDNLRKWGAIYDIPYLSTDTDLTYLNKILTYLRQAPAGGNKLDFENWAKDQSNSFYTYDNITYYNNFATVVAVALGDGTVGIYTIPSDETIIDGLTPAPFPGNIEELLRLATQDYINEKKPLGMGVASVISAKKTTRNIIMEVTAKEGVTLSTEDITTAIRNLVESKGPGETLYGVELTYIAQTFGALNVTVTTPSGDTTVDNGFFLRPGVIIVTEA